MRCIICGGKVNIWISDIFDDRYGAKGLYDIYKCNKCGFGRTTPALEKNKIGAFYRKYYPLNKTNIGQIKKQVDIKNNFNKWLLGTNNISHLYIKRNSRVLDIGSASGVSLLEIKALGAEGYGVEPDPTAQGFAKQLGLMVHKGFISDNPFPKMKFDFVTASQVIEHEPDPLKFLFDIKKKLKPNGKIILTFPNTDALYRKFFGRRWIHWHIPYHINHFSKKSVLLLAKKTGLRLIKTKTITPNLWTLIQTRSLFSVVNVGVPSDVWTNKRSQKSSGGNLLSRFMNMSIYFVNKFAPFIILPVNRIIDSLGYGESFLVELKPK